MSPLEITRETVAKLRDELSAQFANEPFISEYRLRDVKILEEIPDEEQVYEAPNQIVPVNYYREKTVYSVTLKSAIEQVIEYFDYYIENRRYIDRPDRCQKADEMLVCAMNILVRIIT